jgi:hypothetical protein
MSSTARFELAGFADNNGQLGRPVPSGQIVVPTDIRLKGDLIRWRMGDRARFQEVSRDLLDQFILLRDADSVLHFAKKWGVLSISGDAVLLPGREWKKQGSEPIAAWLYYARRASAVLNVAAALKQNKLGDLGDWNEFARLVSNPGEKSEVMRWLDDSIGRHGFGLGVSIIAGLGGKEERLEKARSVIANEITAWLECWKKDRASGVSDITLRWMDDQKRWDLQIDYHGLLFPAIALQLALVIADADSLYSCSGCGHPYIRPRERKRPKAGWANYCPLCSERGVAQRRAVENYREKKSTAARLHSSGKSAKEIADELGTTVAKVTGWLKKEAGDAQTKKRK